MILLQEVKLPYINHALKSTMKSFMKNFIVISKEKSMRTFHVHLLFQAATESLINCALNKNTLTKLALFNSSGECIFEKKS